MVAVGKPGDAPETPIRKGRNNNCMQGFAMNEKRITEIKKLCFFLVCAFPDFALALQKFLQALQNFQNALQKNAESRYVFSLLSGGQYKETIKKQNLRLKFVIVFRIFCIFAP